MMALLRTAALAIFWLAARLAHGIYAVGTRLFKWRRRNPTLVGRAAAERAEVEAARLPAPAASPLALATQQWIESEGNNLPSAAQHALRAVAKRSEAIATQLHGVPDDSSARSELRRLVAEELPELVCSYRRLPSELTQSAAEQGASPDEQLLAGIAIIDGELARLHGRLAERDLRALATHLRYLALKYLPDGEIRGERAPALAGALDERSAPPREDAAFAAQALTSRGR
jgi:hypothetical protein